MVDSVDLGSMLLLDYIFTPGLHVHVCHITSHHVTSYDGIRQHDARPQNITLTGLVQQFVQGYSDMVNALFDCYFVVDCKRKESEFIWIIRILVYILFSIQSATLFCIISVDYHLGSHDTININKQYQFLPTTLYHIIWCAC